MTREEALESGIRQAWRCVANSDACNTPTWAALSAIERGYGFDGERETPDELGGLAVGLQLVAVEVAEIARKRREAEPATSETPGLA